MISERFPFRAGALAALIAALAASAGPLPAQEEVRPTKLTVRAVANDAKVIGSGVGGARITVTRTRTGEVLARGVQLGGTGDTEAIMEEPRRRGEAVYDSGDAAGFTATLLLRRPTLVTVTAEGPLGVPHATQEASKTVLMVPGQHVTGEGVVLTLHGFIVEILEPTGGTVSAGGELTVRTRVRMLCGCPTRPGGLWDSERYDLRARLLKDGEPVSERSLRFTGEESVFGGELAVPERMTGATLTLRVVVSDAGRTNFGMAERNLTLAGATGG